jgi:xanthine dehydrogenase YagR molybdenum-binding subunit
LPLRPLYDSGILFNGQPIALVVAETSEIGRYAASLVRVEYETDAHITDVYRRREAASSQSDRGTVRAAEGAR